MQIKILAFCGSLRRDSLNQKLLDIAVLGALDAGAQVSNIRLRDLPLPIYDGDWETLGGMRAQIALQISLNKLGLLVIPNSYQRHPGRRRRSGIQLRYPHNKSI